MFCKIRKSLKMFRKTVVLLARQSQKKNRCFRVFSTESIQNNSVRNGVLFSDSSDLVIPSANITDVIFDRIASFKKFTAIVSIRIKYEKI